MLSASTYPDMQDLNAGTFRQDSLSQIQPVHFRNLPVTQNGMDGSGKFS